MKVLNDEKTNLTSQLIREGEICQRALEKAHDKFNPQNSSDCIVDPAHGDDLLVHLIGQNIEEFCEGIWNHDLSKRRPKAMSPQKNDTVHLYVTLRN